MFIGSRVQDARKSPIFVKPKLSISNVNAISELLSTPRVSGKANKNKFKFPDRVSFGPARRQNPKTPVVVFLGKISGLGTTPAPHQPF